MKRHLILLLTLTLCLSLCACGGKTKPNPETPAGGWTANSDGGTDFPAEVSEAFRDAMADYSGVGYVPMAYLGTQVVAGCNYAFLCRNTTISTEPLTTLTVVVVYRNLSGESSILRFVDLKLGDLVDESAPEMGTEAGGWKVNTDYPGTLPEGALSAFEKAAPNTAEMTYIPLACLGTQVVAGCNYSILCTALPEEEYGAELCVLEIYQDLEGNASVTAVKGFRIP